MRAFFIWIVSSFFFSTAAHAEYPKPPLEAYGALPMISTAHLSPDGTKVAVIANFENGSRMMVLGIDGSVLEQLAVGDVKARSVEFYDNENIVLRAADTIKIRGYRGDIEYTGAFSYNLQTQKIVQLLRKAKDVYPGQSGLGRIIGRGEKPGEVLMPAYRGDRSNPAPAYDLLKAELSTTRAREHTAGTPDTIDWFVGENGAVLARERYNNREDRYRVQTRKEGRWETIIEEKDSIIPMAIWGVMPDESGLVFVRSLDDETGNDALMKLSFDGEISGPIVPLRDREIDAMNIDQNRKLLGIRYSGLEPDYTFLDERLQDGYDKISEAIPDATIYLRSWSDDREVILYRVFEASLGDVWLTQKRSTNQLTLLARRRPDIPVEALGQLMSLEYKSADGLTIQAIVTTPPDYVHGETAPLPAIFLPHGGPAAYDRFEFNWKAQYFANRGYMVVQPNFRGSSGFGRTFQDAGRGEWGGKMQEDITAGVDALSRAKMIDPDQVCIAGASYGGYAALAGAVFTPNLYKCVIAIAPVSDLNRMLRDEKRDRGSNHWVVSYWEDVMAEGDARRAKLKAISPVNFADQVQAPILLLHGDDDTVVPYAQSTRMRNALRKADKEVELIKLKGEDHWLSIADTRLQTLQAMDVFIAEHLPIAE